MYTHYSYRERAVTFETIFTNSYIFRPTPRTHLKAEPCGRNPRRCTTSIRASQLLDGAENGRFLFLCRHEKKAALHSRRLTLSDFKWMSCQKEARWRVSFSLPMIVVDLTALRAGPPFSWGVTSGGPSGGRSLSKDGTRADSAKDFYCLVGGVYYAGNLISD